ncbi:MAG: class I SAM-dependent methyltransferase [Alphaproteobacteria bacterium]|nr:class I SAM-dependent methyltransferase [Alphaproteobacteria bacterium]
MIDEDNNSKIPPYSGVIYGDIYSDIDKSNSFDGKLFCNLRTFFQYDRLVNAALHGVKINQSVLQLGLVFGDQIDQTAQRVGAYGQYDILDVNGLQVSRNKEKYGHIYPAMNIFQQDASKIEIEEQYDTVLCFMLLQELPPATKAKVINNALRAVKPGGEVVFIDYHKPLFWHPLRYLVRMYNRLKNPFAEKLWDRSIESYANHRTNFTWRKSTYFGRMFQRLVATKKVSPLEVAFATDSNKKEEAFLPDF